jgi:hypothetical protein
MRGTDMNNSSNDQQPSITEQLTHIKDNLQQVKELLESSEFTQETYNTAMALTSEIRKTVVAIMLDEKAIAYYQQQASAVLQESSRMVGIATKKLIQYARAIVFCPIKRRFSAI